MSDPGAIQGPQRVAAFLLSLEPEVATTVLKTLGEDLVAKVAQAMVELDPRLSEDDAVHGLYRAIALELNGPRRLASCDPTSLEAMLGRAFGGQKARQVVQDIQKRRLEARPFLKVEGHPPVLVARVLGEESPAVAALVLSYVAPEAAAAVLDELGKERALEVVRRMATLSPPGLRILRPIAESLEERLALAAVDASRETASDRLKSVADVLNRALRRSSAGRSSRSRARMRRSRASCASTCSRRRTWPSSTSA